MASIKIIIELCKCGQVQKAYEQARADMEQQLPWAQREMGWALNYLMKEDEETNDYQALIAHLDEFIALDKLNTSYDNVLFENILYKVAGFVKAHFPPKDFNTPTKLSAIFSRLRGYDFAPSRGYSFLLHSFIKCKEWQEISDFLDWWNLDKLTTNDYTPYTSAEGKTIMSLAEQAYIVKSKVLLQLHDPERIEIFLPKLEMLTEQHPEMTYPGYFYGKLVVSLGSNTAEALRAIIPFARKKATQFWVWQLLSDLLVHEQDKQLACLLRAVNSKAPEKYLGKVRTKLAVLYVKRNQFDYARYQIDKVTKFYLSNGYRLPNEAEYLIHQPWFAALKPNENNPIDYMAITDDILYEGTKETIAMVTHKNYKTGEVTIVYGLEKHTTQLLTFDVNVGNVLKIKYIKGPDEGIQILYSKKIRFTEGLDYAKEVEGTVSKRADKDFALLITKEMNIFIPSSVVGRYKVKNGETVTGLIVYNYDRKKGIWNWICININKK